MELSALKGRMERYFADYFGAVEAAASAGRLKVGAPGSVGRRFVPHYPTMSLITETPTHFVIELLGASLGRSRLTPVVRALPSLGHVMGEFPGTNVKFDVQVEETASGSMFKGLSLMSQRGQDAFAARFGSMDGMHDVKFVYNGPIEDDWSFHPIILKGKVSGVDFVDTVLIADWNGQVRARYFQWAHIIDRSASSSELLRQLEHRFPIGANTDLISPVLDDERRPLVTAANLAGITAVPKIGETTITDFLEANESILLRALGVDRLIPQPRLEWVEGNPDPSEEWIQPDFLVVDDGGHAHICEVKLPLLDNANVTTGGHKRRRFISPVAEGLAQLANYQEYMTFEPHRRILRERYGVEIVNPRSYLIVGSAENFDQQQVREAQRMIAPVQIVDYDSLRALYLVAEGFPHTPS